MSGDAPVNADAVSWPDPYLAQSCGTDQLVAGVGAIRPRVGPLGIRCSATVEILVATVLRELSTTRAFCCSLIHSRGLPRGSCRDPFLSRRPAGVRTQV